METAINLSDGLFASKQSLADIKALNDEKKFLEHMDKHMKIEGIQDIVIKIFTSKDNYINRLSQLKSLDDKTNEKMYQLIMSITL